jgi:uncharacterized protein
MKKAYSDLHQFILIVIALMMIGACEQNKSSEVSTAVTPQVQEEQRVTAVAIEEKPQENSQFNIGNTRYLFDVSDHSPTELGALLNRAEEIRETHAEGYDDLNIVLILHGPDINIFRQENYNKHKPVVDLAAKLDAFDIIDMKICETSMTSMGVERSEVPAFIESVPYAPDELRRLGEEGYINL